MNKPLPQNIINRRETLNEVLWVAEVTNASSRNTVRAYAKSISEALSLVDNFAINQLSGSVVLAIQLEWITPSARTN